MNKILATLLLFVFCCVTSFSQDGECIDRIRKHVSFFASDSLQGRKAGSSGEKMAARYMYDRLEEAGVIMLCPSEGQDFSIVMDGDTIHSQNVVGIVEGADSLLKNEYVVVGAHIDHLGTNVLTVNGEKTIQVFPGADNNASGLACLIELAERVAASSFSFKRSVIFVGFGAGELGMAGSWYFANKAFSQVDSVSLMVDLNMVGREGKNNIFTYHTGAHNPEITTTIAEVARNMSFQAPRDGKGEMPPSDFLAFYEREIPVVLFTTGKHIDSRTIRDVPSELDYESMERICEFVTRFIREVSNKEEKIIKGGISTDVPEGERIYSVYEVDKTPQFFHGDERAFLQRWVYEYLKYPEVPMALGISGQVIVEFVVEKDGSVTNVKIAKGVDQDLDDEVVRVVSVSPKWKAGTLGGQKVRVKYSVPVEFKLKKR